METLQKERIPTNLTANYVSYWSVSQGIKEAMQNIIFGSIKSETKPVIQYQDGVAILEDFYKGFEKKNLYMGESEQRNDQDGLGHFGEGWKLFLLISARNNLFHKVETVGFDFYGEMVDTPHGVRALEIVIEPNNRTLGTKISIECSEDDFNSGTQGFALVQGISQEFCKEYSIIPDR
jgi:hypothetical protein